MLTKHLMFLFIFTISTVFGQERRVTLGSRLEEFRNCDDFTDGKMTFSDVNLRYVNASTTLVNAKLELKDDISEDFHGYLELTKCDSEQQVDTCQFFAEEKVDGICSNLNNESASVYSFVNAVQNFEKSCPMKKGIYDVKDAFVDFNQVVRGFPLVEGYWDVKGIFSDGEDEVLCVYMEFSVFKQRPQ